MPSVLAIGLDPARVDPSEIRGFTPEVVRAFIEAQLEKLRSNGYEVHNCLITSNEDADELVGQCLSTRAFDCVLIGAGLRAESQLLLFERMINLVHLQAPRAKLCFNTSPADTVEAVLRWT
jgi:predicted dinucleotide-binding enzyme